MLIKERKKWMLCPLIKSYSSIYEAVNTQVVQWKCIAYTGIAISSISLPVLKRNNTVYHYEIKIFVGFQWQKSGN